MMISGARKYVQDDNNYIEKVGKITHICSKCGNVYTTNITLKVECDIICDNSDGYTITTPKINKLCDCGGETFQVDNSMSTIVRVLMDKNYTIKSCCEGHLYIKNGIPMYDYPFVIIEHKLNMNLDNGDLEVTSDLFNTTITCKTFDCLCPCDFNEYKSKVLALILQFVSSLPANKTPNNKIYNLNCDCSCDCQ